jgi:hypothetical protein
MKTLSRPELDIVLPERLPFLESLSWFDRSYRDLPLLDILRRYESGWRYLGLLADPSPEEWDAVLQDLRSTEMLD